MADDETVAAEVVPTATNQEILPLSELQPVIDSKKLSDSEIDLNDSRSTNPDGAQSPASSTYADCEETDLPNSTNADEIANKSDSVSEEVEIVADCEREVTDASPLVPAKTNEDEETDAVDEVEIIPNGEVETDSFSKKESKVDTDCEYVDSDEYEIEGISPDEYGSQDSEEENRENGDGEEVNQDDAVQKKLDDDEDRRNPQYIPKRGFFYEHDDRTADTGVEGEVEGPTKEVPVPEPESKRKGRRSIPDGRWQHDMYKEDEQQAKSTQELVNAYGYDIRNEESAPKARRRRKYGRGPNRFARKWDDEDGQPKQTGRAFRPNRRPKPLPVQREEYDAEFPSLDRQPRPKPKSRERRKSPTPSKPIRNNDTPRNDGEIRHREERRRSPPRKFNSDYVVERSSRSFAKRIPTSASSVPAKVYHNDVSDDTHNSKSAPVRTKFVVNNSFATASRGRSTSHGKPMTRHMNNTNEYEESLRTPPAEQRMQFLPTSRGRAKRLDRPGPNQGFYVGRTSNDDELRDVTEQIAAVDLRTSRNAVNRNDAERRAVTNEMILEQSALASSANRSKRYSYQRQRLLPDSSGEKNVMDAGLHALSAMQQSVTERGGVTANMLQSSGENNALHQQQQQQQQVSGVTVTHNSVPMISENQLTTAPPSNTPSLSVNAAAAPPMPSNSLAVSASLIPMSAPPLTASGAALQAGAPPLPNMVFFQHPPQGFTNQGTPAQIYTREQNMMTAPSNPPVQLVAFLPASPMLQNSNHTPPAPAAPPAPPPPPTYPTSVISYPRASPATQQTQPSFSSETYSMPPVTLAPIHQAEMYQSPGGVTYYNTRSQVKPRSPPPPRVKTAIPIVPPPNEN